MTLVIEPCIPKQYKRIAFPLITAAMSSGSLTFFGPCKELKRLEKLILRHTPKGMIEDYDAYGKILFVNQAVTSEDSIAFEF